MHNMTTKFQQFWLWPLPQ